MPNEQAFYPDGRWEFNQAVATNFEDMLRRSIPELKGLRKLIARIAQEKDADSVFDWGCSDGQMLQTLLEHGVIHADGVDDSLPMLWYAEGRLFDYYEEGRVTLYHSDIREFVVPDGYDMHTCVLTLQFLPVKDRKDVLMGIRGPLILVEKVTAPEFFVQTYHGFKESNGYTRQEIEEKAASLEGVLIPLSPCENETLLRSAGFAHVEPFWQWMNFMGWIAER